MKNSSNYAKAPNRKAKSSLQLQKPTLHKLEVLGRTGKFLYFLNLHGLVAKAHFINQRWRLCTGLEAIPWRDATPKESAFFTGAILSDPPLYHPFKRAAFHQFIIDQAPNFDQAILQDVKLTDGWTDKLCTY